MVAPLDVVKMLKDLRRDVDALKRRSPLANSGLKVTDAGVVTVDGNLVVAGDFTAQGKIANDALISPVRTDSAFAYGSGMAITATGSAPLASSVWSIPAGFTQANVLMAVRLFAMNGSGVDDYLNVRPRVALASSGAEFVGQALQVPVANGQPGLNTSFISVEARDLVAGTDLTLQVQGWTNGASGWAANGINYAELSAQLLWTR